MGIGELLNVLFSGSTYCAAAHEEIHHATQSNSIPSSVAHHRQPHKGYPAGYPRQQINLVGWNQRWSFSSPAKAIRRRYCLALVRY
jgi:hypothetical protein